VKSLRILGAAAALAAFAALSNPAAAQDDQIATKSGAIGIHPVHHAAVVITWGAKRIIVDPAPYPPNPDTNASGDFGGGNPPDLILVTHEHGDHFNIPTLTALTGPSTLIVAPQDVANMLPDALKAKTRIMKNGDRMTIAGIPIEAVPAYNITADRLKFHPKGRDNGYVLTLGGKRVYLAGDTEETPELKALRNIDVAFIPINLPYTETAEAAAQWVKDFRPGIVYPYHTKGMPSGDVDEFKKLVGRASDVRLRNWY
jgi:L-ascorbate metabolism protein UlaG (beta-lactamase superfamily)